MMANKFLLFLSVLAVLSSRTTYGWNLNEICERMPGGNGFAPHPNKAECQKYISCYKFVGIEYSCPDSLEFNQCENVCAPKEMINEKCRCEGWNFDKICEGTQEGIGFFPHPNPEECHKYVSCWEFVGYEVSCPANTEFDRCRILCAYPELIEKKCSCHQ